ncbi:MAG: hypothetical protein KatS3mg131_0071 [Candidatus Tectimicrobiota bacterium]|nr:MAG: hypothetical protein KatS3mg131_0071 [Candidatus Tectomicrobia bacterium]
MPAAGMVWLIIDFTDPRAHQGCGPERGPKTRDSASISVASPTGVPVPWASISSTLRGGDPCGFIGAPQGQLFSLHAGRQHRQAPPVAGNAHAFEHGIDAVAVALGVF